MQNVILQPIEVGGQTNTAASCSPATTGYEKNGMISEQDMGFYTRLAKGGVGYIVLGDVAPINSFLPPPSCLTATRSLPSRHWPTAYTPTAPSWASSSSTGVRRRRHQQSVYAEKEFDEMRQRLHHDMMFFTDEVSEEMLMAIIDKMCACAVRAQGRCGCHPDPRRPPERLPVLHHA